MTSKSAKVPRSVKDNYGKLAVKLDGLVREVKSRTPPSQWAAIDREAEDITREVAEVLRRMELYNLGRSRESVDDIMADYIRVGERIGGLARLSGNKRMGSSNYRRTKDGQEYEYVRRRDGGYTQIPVGPDGYVPVEALMQRHLDRKPHVRMIDDTRVAKVVRPQQLTPVEAYPWWNAPGRSDIVGIDTPEDTPVTWARKPKKAPKPKAKKPKGGKVEAEPVPPAQAPALPAPSSGDYISGLNGRRYYTIDEDLAKRGLESYSWSRYQPGSATQTYRTTVDQVYDMADKAKMTARPALHAEIDSLADQFARRYAEWVNTKNSIDASNVSPMIAGPSRYNWKKRDKQSARASAHYEEYDRIMRIPDRIEELGRADRKVSIKESGAVDSLDAQIEAAEAEQERMKRVNAYWHKHKTLVGCPDVPESEQRAFDLAMAQPGRLSDKPYAEFDLTGNRDRIKRLKSKRDDLARTQKAGDALSTYGDISVYEDAASMRIRVIFPDKPSEQVRAIMKRNGFRWAPSSGCWQRDLNDSGRAAAGVAMREIAAAEGDLYGMKGSKNSKRRR